MTRPAPLCPCGRPLGRNARRCDRCEADALETAMVLVGLMRIRDASLAARDAAPEPEP